MASSVDTVTDIDALDCLAENISATLPAYSFVDHALVVGLNASSELNVIEVPRAQLLSFLLNEYGDGILPEVVDTILNQNGRVVVLATDDPLIYNFPFPIARASDEAGPN